MMETVVNTVLPDIPRIYTALAEWLACLICIIGVKRKINLKLLVGISVGFLVWQSAFLQLTAGAEGIWWMVCMGAAVGFMYFYIAACCDITWKDAGYYCVRAFVIAEFAASLEWQLDCFAYYTLGWKTMWIRGGMLIPVSYTHLENSYSYNHIRLRVFFGRERAEESSAKIKSIKTGEKKR